MVLPLKYYSNAKLLITAEYLVLKGAKALALPLNLGQDLCVEETDSGYIEWISTVKGEAWFNAKILFSSLILIETNKPDKAKKLIEILRFAKSLNPSFLNQSKGIKVKANIEFDLDWGLGSSSTLVSNIAWWAACNPYQLNKMAFHGSGYDIACARSNSPLFYQLIDKKPNIERIEFNPPFFNQLTLVWLNQKQNSREEIGRFDQSENYFSEISEINKITSEMAPCDNLTRFMKLMELHENIISSVIGVTKVKQALFAEFNGAIKSLGAWGGDFILVASEKSFEYVQNYFNQKGFHTVVKFDSLWRIANSQ